MSNVNILITADNAQATAALQQTQSGVTKLGQAAQQANLQGIQNLQKGTVGLANGFRAMQGTLVLLGGQQFPQLTIGVMAAQSAMTGLRGMAEATKLSMLALGTAMTAGLAGAYGIARFIQENVGLWKDTQALEESRKAMMESAADNMAKAYQLAVDAVVQGRLKLTEEEQTFLDRLAASPTPENVTTFNKFLRGRLPPGESLTEAERAKYTSDSMKALEAAREYRNTTMELLHGALPYEQRRFELQVAYNDQIARLNQLRQQGYLNDAQLRDATQGAELQRMQGMIGLGPDPNSFSEQFRAQWTATLTQLGTVAENAAGLVANTFQTALSSVSNALSGLILRTTTWGQALRAIGQSILNEVIQAVVKMFVAWVVGEHAKTTAAVTGSAARTAANTTEAISAGVGAAAEGAKSAAKIPYIGWVLAIAAFAAILAMVLGAAGRERGGPVMAGENYIVGERGPELFVPNQSGTVLTAQDTAALARSGVSGAGRGANINLHAYWDKQQAINAVRDDIEGIVIDTMLRNRYRL